MTRNGQGDGVIWALIGIRGWKVSRESHLIVLYVLTQGVNPDFLPSSGAFQLLSTEVLNGSRRSKTHPRALNLAAWKSVAKTHPAEKFPLFDQS